VALLLMRRGITRIRPLAGGLDAWQKLGLPLVAFVDERTPTTA
jgi:rhodanese-related sulfurtransferase